MVVEVVMWWLLTIFWDTVKIQRPVANNATATAAAADNATAAVNNAAAADNAAADNAGIQ